MLKNFYPFFFFRPPRTNQRGVEAGWPDTEVGTGVVHPEVPAGHGTRLQLRHLSGGSSGE